MFEIWKNIGGLVSINHKKVFIDNFVFQLHYKASVIILLVFSLMVTSRQYIGNPISCVSSDDVKKIADEYCWIHSTFTRGRNEDGEMVYEAIEDTDEIEPGIRPGLKGDDIRYSTYYQWVWCILFIQAAFFYFPHFIWKSFEHGRLRSLVSNLNMTMVDEDDKSKHQEAIIYYFSQNKGYHDTTYVLPYIVCELSNFFNIVSQIYITDLFVNFGFSGYGLEIFSLTQKKPYFRNDALAYVFPTVSACRISTGGLAFGKAEYDLLCVLPINILNEKIYIFLWFWFILLAILTGLAMIYRILTFIPKIRVFLIQRKLRYRDEESVLITKDYINNCSYGDWFIIYKLSRNIDPCTFGSILKELSRHGSKSGYSNKSIEQPLLKSNP